MPDAQTLFDALETQSGLRVETQISPVEMLLVDRLERIPSEN